MVGVAAYFLPTMRGWNLAAWEQARSVENEQFFAGMAGVHIPIWNGWAVLPVGCLLTEKMAGQEKLAALAQSCVMKRLP